MRSPAWRRPSGWPFQLALLALAVAAAYARTFDVPFYLDDYSSILENDRIYRWQGLGALWEFAPLRVLGYASFALDYRRGHFDPAVYHLTNLVIHILATTAVWSLVRGLLRAPRLEGRVSPGARAGLPLLVALLFGLHPLQTQAVTYIVQRLASLAALFYIAALASFLEARLARVPGARIGWSALALLCAACALLSKESAATLPLALVLIECVFFRRDARGMIRAATAGAGGMVVLWFAVAAIFGRNPLSLEAMRPLTTDATLISRPAYLATQMPALWTYIRLFFWPAGLHLDHADRFFDGFAHPVVWIALAGHLLVLALGLWAWRSRPLVTFALLFYYLAHLMESSIFPLQDMIFEHRAYLPDLGLCLLVGWALGEELPRRSGARLATALAAAVVLLLGLLTWQRNQQWRDPLAFWRDNVRLAPTKARAWGSLARRLIEADQPAEAAAALHRSIELRSAQGAPDDPLDIVNLSVALQMMGRGDSALTLIERGLAGSMEPRVRSRFHLNRGNIAYESGRLAEAEADFRQALALDPSSIMIRVNLASALAQSGRLAEAETLYQEVLEVDPANAAARENLAKVREARGAGRR